MSVLSHRNLDLFALLKHVLIVSFTSIFFHSNYIQTCKYLLEYHQHEHNTLIKNKLIYPLPLTPFPRALNIASFLGRIAPFHSSPLCFTVPPNRHRFVLIYLYIYIFSARGNGVIGNG